MDTILAADIDEGEVGASEIDTDAVGASEIDEGAVGASEIDEGAVGTSEIAENGVNTSEIAENAVTDSEINADAVGASEIGEGAVGASEIATDAVGQAEIVAGGVDLPTHASSDRTIDDITGELFSEFGSYRRAVVSSIGGYESAERIIGDIYGGSDSGTRLIDTENSRLDSSASAMVASANIAADAVTDVIVGTVTGSGLTGGAWRQCITTSFDVTDAKEVIINFQGNFYHTNGTTNINELRIEKEDTTTLKEDVFFHTPHAEETHANIQYTDTSPGSGTKRYDIDCYPTTNNPDVDGVVVFILVKD